jgi:hypothetical protein
LIEQFLDSPDAFTVADAGDPYRRLRVLEPADVAMWESARRTTLAGASGLVTTAANGDLAAFATVRDLPGDSAALGLSVGALEAIGVRRDHADETAVLDALLRRTAERARGSYRVLTALVDLDRSPILAALHRAGAQVFGANTGWIRSVQPNDAVTGLETTEPSCETNELLQAVALAYATYRSHYRADPAFDGVDSTSVYVEAVRQHLRGGGPCTIRRDPDGITAFATLEAHDELNTVLAQPVVAEIGVAGVVPRARGRGLLGSTIHDALHRVGIQGFRYAYYGCAADNFAAQSALVAVGGFRPRRFCLRLHWWLGP